MRAPDFWSKEDFVSRVCVTALAPLGWLYGASIGLRQRWTRPSRTRARVVCVGNLTAGGTGKTPVAIAVAHALRARGGSVCFLSRGYGGRLAGPVVVDLARHGASDVGDEPLLLAQAAPVVVSRDRRAGARLAEDRGADVIVMDDGHQNFELQKDVSIVVIDASNPIGNGRMLPAGPLREPMARGLARADVVVLMGAGNALPETRIPTIRAKVAPRSATNLAGQRIVAFAGIGHPERFFDTLEDLGAIVVGRHAFDDHHVYKDADVAGLKASAQARDAKLFTTEKDFVRLTKEQQEGIQMLPVQAVFEDAEILQHMLAKLGPRGIAAQ